MDLIEGYSGRHRIPADRPGGAFPLVVAIHGGTYTSAYFAIPGRSLLDRAAALRVPIVALDRPGYEDSTPLPPAEATIAGQARHLLSALGEIFARHGAGCSGIVLIGHSIGGAIAATIASDPGGLPIIGLAVSGVGLRTPAQFGPMWASLPDEPFVELPLPLKDQVMFGPAGSFDPSVPVLTHAADAPAPRAELIDIVGDWQKRVGDVLGRIAVPVHYRQAEFDHLWVVDDNEVAGFAAALSVSPRVDAAMMRGTGHCIDFHHVGGAFQVQQLGFALQCAVEAG
jgi:pimeloyl-ACP methyl ester carboxylesterase